MIEISKMGFQYSGSDRMALRDITSQYKTESLWV